MILLNNINDEKLLNALNEKIKKAKINYYELYPLWSVVNKETLLDEKLELNSLKIIYFYSLLDEERKEVTYEYYAKIKYIKDFLKLLNIDENIIHDWKNEALYFFKNILNNIDKYLKINASFVSLEKHSNYYKKYIENSIEYIPYLNSYSPIDIAYRILSYFICYSDLNNENFKLINNCILYFKKNNEKFNFVNYFDIGEKIITKDGNNGLLIKSYNTNLFSIYYKLAKNYIYEHHKDSINVADGLLLLAEKINDTETIQYCKEKIAYYEDLFKKEPLWYDIKVNKTYSFLRELVKEQIEKLNKTGTFFAKN